jgi:hypothetical protein
MTTETISADLKTILRRAWGGSSTRSPSGSSWRASRSCRIRTGSC